MPDTLAGMKDCYRPLILFTPSVEDPRARQQLGMLERDELLARNVLIVLVTETVSGNQNTSGAKGGLGPEETRSPVQELPSVTVSEEERERIREKFHMRRGTFAVILVGKDGGEKIRREHPLTSAELNKIIDAMPMRQQEMSEQPSTKGTIRKRVP